MADGLAGPEPDKTPYERIDELLQTKTKADWDKDAKDQAGVGVFAEVRRNSSGFVSVVALAASAVLFFLPPTETKAKWLPLLFTGGFTLFAGGVTAKNQLDKMKADRNAMNAITAKRSAPTNEELEVQLAEQCKLLTVQLEAHLPDFSPYQPPVRDVALYLTDKAKDVPGIR